MAWIKPALIALLLAAPSVAADDWTPVREKSTLTFSATQAGVPFSGRFERFDTTIHYDANHPAGATIRAEIDLASAITGAEERDNALPTAVWFNIGAFPKAIFEATGFTPLGDDRFETDGTLTLKGVTAPVTLQFTQEVNGDTAQASGDTEIVRTNFDVGSGEFESGKWISKAVTVSFNLTATRINRQETP